MCDARKMKETSEKWNLTHFTHLYIVYARTIHRRQLQIQLIFIQHHKTWISNKNWMIRERETDLTGVSLTIAYNNNNSIRVIAIIFCMYNTNCFNYFRFFSHKIVRFSMRLPNFTQNLPIKFWWNHKWVHNVHCVFVVVVSFRSFNLYLYIFMFTRIIIITLL